MPSNGLLLVGIAAAFSSSYLWKDNPLFSNAQNPDIGKRPHSYLASRLARWYSVGLFAVGLVSFFVGGWLLWNPLLTVIGTILFFGGAAAVGFYLRKTLDRVT